MGTRNKHDISTNTDQRTVWPRIFHSIAAFRESFSANFAHMHGSAGMRSGQSAKCYIFTNLRNFYPGKFLAGTVRHYFPSYFQRKKSFLRRVSNPHHCVHTHYRVQWHGNGTIHGGMGSGSHKVEWNRDHRHTFLASLVFLARVLKYLFLLVTVVEVAIITRYQ